MIHLGDDAKTGKRFSIPIWHTGIYGQSGVGKTKLLKYMCRQAVDEEFRVLCIDSRLTNPEFAGIGAVDLPLYLEESTDPDVFRSLIEQMRTRGRGNMERYRGGFIEVCEGAKSFAEIGRNLHHKLGDKKIKGYTRTMYYEINHDYEKLQKLLGKFEFAKSLQLPKEPCIMRMETRILPTVSLQGLVVRSVLDELLRRGERRLIVLIDEAPNFCHQDHYNPAKEAIQMLDNQGRAVELFGWYSGQTLTGFDKANMKNLQYWALGREMERNEAKAVFDTQTYNVLSVQQIRQLKTQEFLAITPDETRKIFVPTIDEKQLFLGPLRSGRPAVELVEKKNAEPRAPRQKGREDLTPPPFLKRAIEKEIERAQECPKSPSGMHHWNDAIVFSDPKVTAMCDYCQELAYEPLTSFQTEDEEEIEEVAEQVLSLPKEALDTILVTERVYPFSFTDDSIEGMIGDLIADGFFNDVGRNGKDVHAEIDRNFVLAPSTRPGANHGSDFLRDKVMPALRLLSRRPYMVLREDGAVYLKGPRPVTHKTKVIEKTS